MPILGGKEFAAALASRAVEVLAVTEIAVKEAGEVVQQAAVDKLMQKEHSKGSPTPSLPGEPPAMISGALKASVHVDPVSVSGGRFETKVGGTTPYARIQELGGTAGHGARLPARPYLKPALDESHEKLHAVFVAAWSALGRGLAP